MNAFFPLSFANEETSLLTAIVLGFLFGFTLERGGFGNARKLAAQFYLHDMTVFKVMFTAILVAMVGLYGFAALGWVDLSLLWINPTFMWSQVVGGFLLGVGFIISGLCPGTAVVSAFSGRLDAVVAFIGIFLGTFLFALAIDVFPFIDRLYMAGSLGTSLLPDVFGVPAPLLALLIVLGAGAAFVGAEKVEKIFASKRPALALAPTVRPRLKYALPGALALLALGATFVPARHPALPAPAAQTITASQLADRVIAHDAATVVLDVRSDRSERGVPGAQQAALDSSALAALANVTSAQLVVVMGDGSIERLPAGWPTTLHYAVVAGGFASWRKDVLTPAVAVGPSLEERQQVARQNQVAAYFSGATVTAASSSAPPPAAAGGGGAKKKKGGGC